jgi:hypothetical protein
MSSFFDKARNNESFRQLFLTTYAKENLHNPPPVFYVRQEDVLDLLSKINLVGPSMLTLEENDPTLPDNTRFKILVMDNFFKQFGGYEDFLSDLVDHELKTHILPKTGSNEPFWALPDYMKFPAAELDKELLEREGVRFSRIAEELHAYYEQIKKFPERNLSEGFKNARYSQYTSYRENIEQIRKKIENTPYERQFGDLLEYMLQSYPPVQVLISPE